MKPVFFRSAAEFRRWLTTHHKTATELWVGFYKKQSGKVGISYLEAVEQALCFGWIDGIKKRLDEHGYTHRFSPRTAKSVWSTLNVTRIEALKRRRLMKPAGLEAFESRDVKRTALYSYENRPKAFDAAVEAHLKKNRKAWTYFEQRPPGYRRVVFFYVMSAKQEETRVRRLNRLISFWEQGRTPQAM